MGLRYKVIEKECGPHDPLSRNKRRYKILDTKNNIESMASYKSKDEADSKAKEKNDGLSCTKKMG